MKNYTKEIIETIGWVIAALMVLYWVLFYS